MTSVSSTLAQWATQFDPSREDLALADRALLDTVAVTIAGRDEPIHQVAACLPEAARWSVAGHILDFDDLHVPTTTHISTVCVPVALALGGGPRDYLAGAGVMTRLGLALGWQHYDLGWHATATTGVIAAAAVAASCLDLSQRQTANAFALAVSSSGGVQRAFGSDAKSLQVGIAAQAGIQAARLAAAGASAHPMALEQWLSLVGATSSDGAMPSPGALLDPTHLAPGAPAVPGGLAIKLYPCCYALQRPIGVVRELRERVDPGTVQAISLTTPAVSVTPLNQHHPTTGLEGKFSLEYAVAAALLDPYPGFATFSDDAVRRPQAAALQSALTIELTDEPGSDLLTGQCTIRIQDASGTVAATMSTPPGAATRPPTDAQLSDKVSVCLAGTDLSAADITWDAAPHLLRRTLPQTA